MVFFSNFSLPSLPPSLPLSRGADLKSLVREAAIAALRQHMQLSSDWLTPDQSDHTSSLFPVVTKVGGASEGAKVDGEECVVAMENFVSALKRVKPSVSGKVIGRESCHAHKLLLQLP